MVSALPFTTTHTVSQYTGPNSTVAFGLCLCALLGAKHVYFLIIMLVCAVWLILNYLQNLPNILVRNLQSLPIVTFIFHVTGNAELPGTPFFLPLQPNS